MITRIIGISLIIFLGISSGQNFTTEKYLTLEDAISIGLKNSPQLKSSTGRINLTNAKFWSGISLPSPELTLSYEYVPNGYNLNHYGERNLGVSQSFEFPSNYFLRGSILYRQEEIAKEEFNLSQLEVILKIKSAYFTVLAKQELLKNGKDNLSLAQDFADKAAIRYDVGEGTNLEKLTAKVQFSEALNTVELLKNQVESALSELICAMGLGNGNEDEYALTDRLEFKSLSVSLGELYNETVDVNPNIKINKLSLTNSTIQKTLAWSSLLPNFNIGYYRQSLDGINKYYGASFGISIPVWFLFDQRGKIEEAAANVSIAEAELQLKVDAHYLKLKKAFIELKNSESQIHLYEDDLLPQTEEIFRSAGKSYDAGEINYIEYLQAKQTVINSKNNYINALLTYNLSFISLEDAVGKRIK